ncbi:UDP-glucose 4-epimerase GalE [Roseobacter sp. HKCCD9010]|uniref:UDP-glucose 4-epimerase GalE n=1 Tax=unclassified Roseobacter TaxID=196798 RepID=UPI0014928E0A|nr:MULTISPECIES: UDP-glucose 4-epimerase GalE [unclassified Roseobacter]MBF9048491.1 UDP-glucose 4-epimerase GalE [Rhodobacterales bacterium HKCCD4356]NNV10490.1 UDP-glucose 4-epimerase GalE [Roseobacter sp. HKCCD7357]NNV14675.1 UDP-glucose 4-epimerase GalE [Roseobacter sp. HKCCD8768]NNV24134.1 UDP-glucose 4-epimerase GalE [Roseobacter sp. HKCCD8192]NNV28391.1 UDP-glucose 4-epimerase GalE [Roseobacter sp. HKCCD9061]
MAGKILLAGGAGYIGSHTYLALVAAGFEVIIFDNFVNSHPSVTERLAEISGAPVTCVTGDVRDSAALDRLFAEHDIAAVVHFAALKSVADSVKDPLGYLDNNLGGLVTLLTAMDRAVCRNLVFSSSATVYGIPDETPTPETAERRAMNPYGRSKIMCEEVLEELAAADAGWAFGILRYFNPAGAHPSGLIGEDPKDVPNNLMPFVAKVAIGEIAQIKVFGNDYPTPDGTGVRDYIHVEDLARGHLLSLQSLLSTGQGHVVNLGTGKGQSVLDVINAYSAACGQDLPFVFEARRPGDVPIYCAQTDLAKSVLGFETEKSLADMCESSWHWVASQAHLTRP